MEVKLEFGSEEHIRLLKKTEKEKVQAIVDSRNNIRKALKRFFDNPCVATEGKIISLLEEYIEKHGA